MWRDGLLAYDDADQETAIEKATSTFVYADTGEDVPKGALVIPWGSDVPAEKLRRLEDILGAYASKRGWDYMEIGDEI
jgi:hypothetical protein